MSRRLASLAGVAVPEVPIDLFAHTGPVVAATEEFQSLGPSRVAGGGYVVVAAEEFQAKGVVVRHVQAIAVVEAVAVADGALHQINLCRALVAAAELVQYLIRQGVHGVSLGEQVRERRGFRGVQGG